MMTASQSSPAQNPTPQANVLKRIIASKAAHIAALKQRFGEQPTPQVSQRSLYDALNKADCSFILECKKASPSKGLLRPDFDIAAIAAVYRRHADAISVLTDEQYFQGDMAYISQIREQVSQPILCKDFFISPYQVQLAASQGADAILLMLSVLTDVQYRELATEAQRYQLDILTEVSNPAELQRALALQARIIGINNRNLRDLSTDLATTEQLAPTIPPGTVIVSESGIYRHEDVRRLSPYVSGFLVGSSLMGCRDLDLACRRLIYGNHKVCGLTRADDLLTAAQAGAVYGGLIFAPASPRAVTQAQAAMLAQANTQAQQQLQLVGVFVKQAPTFIAAIAKDLKLSAVQLHGKESEADIATLRQLLSADTEIWQAVAIKAQTDTKPLMDKADDATAEPTQDGNQLLSQPDTVTRRVYDSQHAGHFGGTGKPFNWQQPLAQKHLAMLAGGLTPETVAQAAQAGFAGLDMNSGLETAPGQKDPRLIYAAFANLRHY